MLRVLRALLRLACLRAVDAADFAVGQGALAGLIALGIAFDVAASALACAPPRSFALAGLERHSLWLALALVLAWIAAREVERPSLVQPIFAALVGTLIARDAVEIAAHGIARGLGEREAVSLTALPMGLFAWRLALVARALDVCTGLRTLRSVALCGLYATVVWGIGTQLPAIGFWYTSREPGAATQRKKLDAESLLHGEASRVAAAVGALEPERPGVPDLYLVSFAADATQGVFRREVELVQALFDERFDTHGRSLSLVNSESSAFARLLASASNLGDALAALGTRIDVEDDVLFLFLTGHGGQDARLAVRFPPLPLNDVTPARLAEQLDVSGIRFRVIVISACYAGTFLEPLRGDDTLVITAASADRQSFGCSDRAELTDFGRAFFAEALHQERSFPAAFELARTTIAERERQKKLTASRPQIALGPGMAAKLRELESRLAPTTTAAR